MASSSHQKSQTKSSRRPRKIVPSPQPQLSLPLETPALPPTITTAATTTTTTITDHINPNPSPCRTSNAADKGKSIVSSSNSADLTFEEVIKRRSDNLKELAACYAEHYWKLMEELKNQHTAYVWKYGKNDNGDDIDGDDETNNGGILKCAANGCKYKAMALTSYCKLHILFDPRQQLYKPCAYVLKSALTGSITCDKPILQSTVPSFCDSHMEKGEKHLIKTLKKAGLDVSYSDKIAPKLNVLAVECVRKIQSKRKVAMRAN